jgi:hypothetical protein
MQRIYIVALRLSGRSESSGVTYMSWCKRLDFTFYSEPGLTFILAHKLCRLHHMNAARSFLPNTSPGPRILFPTIPRFFVFQEFGFTRLTIRIGGDRSITNYVLKNS